MAKDVGDSWTELVSDDHSETVYTLEVEGEDVWVYKTSGERPAEPEKGITARANESRYIPLERDKALYARSQVSGNTAQVRVVPGMRAESDGRANVNADLVGTPSVDPSDRAGRNLGKARLMGSGGNLIDGSNPFPVDVTDDITRSAGTVRVESVSAITATDSGTGQSNAAVLNLGDYRTTLDVFVDTAGSATLTVEVSPDGGTTWRQYDTVSYSSATTSVEGYDVAYPDVRAYLDTNRNLVEAVAKGV